MEQTQEVQTLVTPEVLPTEDGAEAIRREEMLLGALPSQKIRMIQSAMMGDKLEKIWEKISQAKLRPDCPPQTLQTTKGQVAQALTQDYSVMFAAILAFLDSMYIMTLRQQGEEVNAPAEGSPASAPSPTL